MLYPPPPTSCASREEHGYHERRNSLYHSVIAKCVMLSWLFLFVIHPFLSGTTYHVGPVGSQHPFTSIQAAIDTASAGDTIIVHCNLSSSFPTVYMENLVIEKSLYIASDFESSGNQAAIGKTIVDGSLGGNTITICGDHSTGNYVVARLAGFTIQNGNEHGVHGVTACYIQMNDCRVKNNDQCGLYLETSSAVINRSEVFNNGGTGIHSEICYTSTVLNSTIYNNGTSGLGAGSGIRVFGLSVDHCAIWGNSNYGIDNTFAMGGDFNVRNSIIWGNTVGGLSSDLGVYYYNDIQGFNPQPSNGNINADPLFTNPTAGDFSLRWNEFLRSPCIDTGDPDPNNSGVTWHTDVADRDVDGSRRDMGAVPARAHRHNYHTLQRQTANTWNWISFPAVDKLHQTADVDDVDFVFDTFHGNGLLRTIPNRILQDITWKYNSTDNIVEWVDLPAPSHWALHDETVNSQYGYKVRLLQNQAMPTLKLEYNGFKPGEAGNANKYLHLEKVSAGQTYNEVWLGYGSDKNLDPLDALESVVDDLIWIQTRDWAYSRHTTADPWNLSNNSQSRPCLKYGMCVVVHYCGDENVDFWWGEQYPERTFVPEPIPDHFAYAEDSDYVPIYVDIDGIDIDPDANAELAVFAGDRCVGAEVVTGDTLQINAYIINDSEIAMEDLEFVYWDGAKRGGETRVKRYATYNFTASQYETETIPVASRAPFHKVRLDFKAPPQGDAPLATCLRGNFPNPFNPETTIRFDLATEGQTRLVVYNVRGQRVKTLTDGKLPAGQHSVVWDGRDENGIPAASGMYFYRLESGKDNLVRRMLLLK